MLNPCFTKISERICQAHIQFKNKVLYFISAYAPTLQKSETDQEQREVFYEQLNNVVKNINSKHLIFIAGDFNAKTGGSFENYPNNIGKYGRGNKTNSNGDFLLDLAYNNNLCLTNTLFNHKLSHRTTWTSPETSDDNNRRNPYRNQIDYIITKNMFRNIVLNSRSYSGIETYTDHNQVKAEIRFEWHRINKPKIE